MRRLLIVISLLTVGCFAQNPPYTTPVYAAYGTVLPTLCNNGSLFYNVLTFQWFNCGPINSWGLWNLSPIVIASGTATMGTTLIGANACANVVSISAIGILPTSKIVVTTNQDVSGVTGYGYMSTDGLKIYVYPTMGLLNFKVCNPTANGIIPGSAIGLNYLVM